MNAEAEQTALVKREAAKRTKHMALRKLAAAAPDVLTALRPCWMASPLSVSQLLTVDRRYFDVVVFDEASQVLPEDGVPAILRGARVIVAGDHHQLPPTPFFVGGEDDEEDDETATPTEGLESVLDVMRTFVDPWTLEWHYRSQDESLIAFANHHIYGDSLVTFPAPVGPQAVSLTLVGASKTVQQESPTTEVDKVVELVLRHAVERPSETLGVIALGIKHARRVEAAVEAAARTRPEVEAFFSEDRAERFFVKNLERVQGDERDAIILTLGAGKDQAGRVDYRQFGPLNQTGGERRLNVAVTRARRRMAVVSSFGHTDMDPARSGARGVELLRRYLEYAASGGVRLGDGGPSSVPLNPFELDVYDALSAKGIALLPQWGASRYRIDLVARHPSRSGRFVLAIECDGASYHAVPTARDRDRLRQQHLEALGWRFHRIWSTDWFMRREEEITRTFAAYEAAVALADRYDFSNGDGAATASVGAGFVAKQGVEGAGASVPAGVSISSRASRPRVPRRDTIQEYSLRELVELVQWIRSDGCLRTDEEIIEEMVGELGFERRGRNIEAAIRRAIQSADGDGQGTTLRGD
jgi:very-short-patch-repair endonuclease